MREVCDGPACRLRAVDLGGAGVDGARVGCLGRCDAPVAAFDTAATRALTIARRGVVEPATLATVGRGRTAPLLLRNVGFADQPTRAAAERRGAYRALAAVERDEAAELVAAVAGLTARRELVVACRRPLPGAFAPRPLCERDPHLVLEAVALAARGVGAEVARLTVPPAWTEARRALAAALDEARAAGRLDATPTLTLALGDAGGDVGLGTLATMVRAVEGLGAADGDTWADAHPPPRLRAISGDVLRPGVYELPAQASVAEAIAEAGGVVDGVRTAALGAFVADGVVATDATREAPGALVVFHAGRDPRAFI